MMGVTDAETNVNSNALIDSTGGSVTLGSTANTTATSTARVSQNIGGAPANPDSIAVSLAIGVVNQTAQATVSPGATVMAAGDVNLTATGTGANTSIPTTGTYVSGLAGAAVGVDVTENTIKANADGTLISDASATSPTLSLDPDTDVDFANSAFEVSPGAFASLQTGQPYTYSSGNNGAIGGLTSGTVYYIIVPTNLTDEIRLAATLHDAEQGNFIPFQQYPTLTGGSTSVPISDVDETDGTITFDSDPGFTDGEALTYHAVAGQLIGGLTGGTTYYAIVNPASPDTLQLSASAPSGGVDGPAIPLNLDPVFQGFRQALPVTINPSGDLPNSIQFGFDAGFQLGASLIYQGSGISGLTDGVRYWAIPDPKDSTVNSTVIQLADSYADAQAGTALAIGSNAPGGQNGNTLTFDPSVSIDSQTNTIDLGFNYALANTLPSGTPLVYYGALGSAVANLTDGTTYYVIQDSANPSLMRLTTAGAAQAIAAATAGTDNYNTQYQTAYNAAYQAYVSNNPTDPHLVQDATNAGNAAAQAAAAQADNGEDWTAAAIDSARIGNPPPVGTFPVTVDPVGQTVDFGFNAGFVKNQPLVYEGPATGSAGIIGLTPGDTYYVTLPDRVNNPGLVQFTDDSGNVVPVSLASGTTTSVMFGAPTSDNVSVSSNQLTFNNPDEPTTPFDPGFNLGDPMVYLGPVSLSNGDVGITGLVPGTVYYVITTSTPGVIQLADSYANAELGTALTISLPSGSTATNINYTVPFTPADTRPLVVTQFGSIDTATMSFTMPFTASPTTLTPVGMAGVNVTATLTDSESSFTASGIGGEPSVADKILKPELVAPQTNSAIQNAWSKQFNSGSPSAATTVTQNAPGATGQGPDLSLAGAVFIQVVPVDIVTAEVASTAVIESASNVTVAASLTQTVDTSVTASFTGQSGPSASGNSGLAGALALGIGYYTPTVHATIDSGAQVDAAGTLAVTATTQIPFEVPTTVNGVEGDIVYNPDNPNYNPLNFVTSFVTDGMLGLGTDILNNSASAKVDPKDEDLTSIGGNIQVFVYVNDTEATIGDAQINQKVSDPNALGTGQGISFQNASQSVTVQASTTYENAAEAGQFELNVAPYELLKAIRDDPDDPTSAGFNPFGDVSGTNAIGASVFVGVLDNTTLATIDSGAQIGVGSSGTLDVQADQQIIAVSLVQSGDAGGNIGVAGMLAWFNVTSHTQAQIQDGVTVNGGYDANGNPVQGGAVNVDAADNTIIVGVTGGAVKSNATGVGFAMAVNNVNRTTLALIGSTSTPTEPGSYDISALDVNATDQGLVATVTYAAVSVSPSEGQVKSNDDPVDPDIGGLSFSDLGSSNPLTQQSGYGIAGAVSANVMQSDTEAYVNDKGTFQTASSSPLDPTAQPTTVINLSQPPNLPTGTPVVYTSASPIGGLTSGQTYYVIATDPYDLELAATAADAAAGTAIALDPTNATGTQTLTPANGSALTFTPSAVEATVLDFANPHGLQTGQALEYVAGSGAIGGLTSGQTYYAIVVDPNRIELANSFANAQAGVALALDFAQASGAQTFVPDTFSIHAATRTIVVSVAGGLAMSNQQIGSTSSSNAIAGALSTDDVIDTTKAYLENATVTTADLDVTADHGGYIGSLTAGAAGASGSQVFLESGSSNAVAGSVSIDVDLPDTEAYVQNATLTLGGDSWVTANESAEIVAIAGSGAYGGSKGFGVAIAINLIGFDLAGTSEPANTLAYITDSTVTLDAGTLSITATDAGPTIQPQIIAITGAGGVGAGDDSIGGGGMIAVNDIQDETNAYVEGSTITQPSGASALANLDVEATDSSGIIAIGGALGVGGEAGLGAAIGFNVIAATTSAYLDSSTIDVNGTVTVTATDTALIGSATIGVGVTTGSGGLAGAGSVSINEITDTTDAHISNMLNTSSSVTSGGSTTVKATDHSTIGSVAGGVAGASEGAAIGAAISYNLIQNSILAYVDDSTVTTGGDLDLSGTSSPILVAIAVGAAGSGEGFALGGSITVNSIANDVDTHISDSTVDASSGSVNLQAVESAVMVVLAGGIAISLGGAAFGASIAYNYIGGSFDPANPNAISKPSTTTNHQISATITNSKVTAGQNVSVEASFGPPPDLPGSNDSLDFGYTSVTIPVDINSMLVSVTVGGAGADGFALGGSVNLNFLRESVNASISSDTPADGNVQAGGVVTVSATDSSTLGAGAGALAISPTAGAVGAAISTNDVANSIAAGISGATVTAASVYVISGESATIINVTVAGSGAADFAVGGSVSVNLIANNVSASISGGADVTATSTVAVTASDTSTIDSFSGQGSFAASGVGAGVAVGFNDVADTVDAYISGATTSVTSSGSNVLIQADSTPTIMTFTGGLAIGTVAGLAGSVSIDIMGCDTEAYIDAATVTADGSVYLLADTADTVLTYAGTISGSAGVGVGGTVAVNDLHNTTKARIDDGANVVSKDLDNSTIGVPQWATDANGTESTQQVEGVVVIATDTETLGDLAITGAVGVGAAGIGLNIEVDVFNDTTDAHIAGSTVTSGVASGGAVIVRAHRSTGITSAGGVLGVGAAGAGIGAVVAADIDSSTTVASINAATVSAGSGGVEVSALTRETVGTTTVGLGVGLYAGVAGGASAADVTTATEAYITDGSTVDSDGNLTVLANSGVTVTPSDGVLGAGAVGGGGGIAVGLIGQTTLAQIDASTTNASGLTDVEADSTETVNSTAVAAGGGIVGIAGAIAVVSLSSATSASIVDSNVNQDSSYAVSGQNVEVLANDTASVTDKIGSAAIGAVAAGAGIDVISVENTVDANISGSSKVSAMGSVQVLATATENVSSTAFSFAVSGGVSLNGTVSVIGIGSGLDSKGLSQLNSIQTTVDSSISLSGGVPGVSQTSLPGPDPSDPGQDATTATNTQALNVDGVLVANTPPAATQAYIGGTAVIDAGGGVTVSATETLPSVTALVGQGSGGIVSVGGSVATITVAPAVLAFLGDGVSVTAGGAVDVSATFSDNVTGKTYAGTVGYIGLGAQVTLITDNATEDAFIGGASVDGASSVSVTATATRNDDAEAAGGTFGLVAAGAAIAQTTLGGSTTAAIGTATSGAQIGTQAGSPVGAVTVQATSTDTATANTLAVAAGIGAGTANVADSEISPTIQASIGANSQVLVGQNVMVDAESHDEASATDFGVQAGAVAVGVSLADANMSPIVKAFIDSGAQVAATNGAITVQATQDTTKGAQASGSSSGVSAGTGEGANITATAAAQVDSYIGSGATLHAGGTVTVDAAGANIASATASTLSVGVVLNVAAIFATATASGDVNAYLGTGAVVGTAAQPAGGLDVEAAGADQSTAVVNLSGGGAFSGSGGNATAKTSPALSAYLGNGSSVDVTGNVTVESTSTTEGHANTTGANGGIVNVNESLANVFVTPTINTYIGSNATIVAGGSITVESVHGTTPVPVSNGSFTPSQVSNNEITFTLPDGLQTGDTVTYAQNGNPPIGGLTDGSVYPVIAVNPYTLELGPSFDAAQVNTTNDTIVFASPDDLQTGDEVVYEDNGGTPIGGLTSGDPYLVRVIDPETIKLVDPTQGLLTPTSFDPATTVSNNTINLPGFSNGQAVTYTAPAPLEFAPQQVSNSIIDLGDDSSGKPIPDNFSNGQAVVYSLGSGAAAIGGLSPGSTYYVITDGTNQFELSATVGSQGNPGAAITLDPTSANGLQILTAANEQPIGGLVSGNTYYVVNATATPTPSFQLAATLGGSALTLNASNSFGTHTIGVEGLVFTSAGTGTQDLVIPLNTTGASGTYQLIGVGGASSLLNAPTGDGEANAGAIGSGGGAVQIGGSDANVTSSPTVATSVGSSANLKAGGDIEITSTSYANTSADGTNSGGGFVAVGGGTANISTTNTNSATVGDSAVIATQGNFTLQALSYNNVDGSSDSSGGGVVSIASAGTTANVNFNTQASVGQDAQVTALSALLVESQSNTAANVNATADGGGLGVNSNADAELYIGSHADDSNVATTQTTIGTGAALMAENTTIDAVTSYSLLANSNSTAKAFAADSTATAKADANDTAHVTILTGANITGTNSVDIEARHDNLQDLATAVSNCDAAFGSATANTEVDLFGPSRYDSTQPDFSQVDAAAGATIKTAALTVKALATFIEAIQDPSAGGGFIVGHYNNTSGQVVANRTIHWNADVISLSGPSPLLIVDANGTVDPSSTITPTISATQITVPNISNSATGTITFVANQSFGGTIDNNNSADGLIDGSQATFHYQATSDKVQLLNNSTLDMEVNNIDFLSSSTATHDVDINVQNDTNSNDAFAFNVVYSYAPTLVDIENRSTTGSPNIILNGLINNPIGTTEILNASGNIESTGPQAVVVTNILDVKAANGQIGSSANPLNAELVQSEDLNHKERPIQLTVLASGSAYFNFTGILRDPDFNINQTPFIVPLNSIQVGGDFDAQLEESEQDSAPGPADFGITVYEDYTGLTTAVTTYFRPGTGNGPSEAIDPGFYDGGASLIDSTYSFADLTAGGNIELTGVPASTPIITITGFTNINPNGPGTGQIDASTNGNITLTETSGAMRVGTITSTAGNVALTVPDDNPSGDDLLLANSSSISAGGSVTLLVADNISIAAGATITAGAPVLIQDDYGKSGPGIGSTITVAGVIYAPSATIQGGDENDTFNLTNVASGTVTLVDTGGGVNVVNLGSLVPLTGGIIDLIKGPLTVQGSGADTMNVDDTGSTASKSGTLTSTTLTGLNMGPSGITYSGLANLNIDLGSGGNTFLISNTAAGTTTFLNSGTGADTVNVQATSSATTVNTGGGSNHNIVNVGSLEPASDGIVNNIQGALTVAGNGADTMNVDDTGSTIAKTGTLTSSALTGLNMGPSGITYSGLANLNIKLGSGGNTFFINSTAVPTSTFLNSGTGADTVNVRTTGGPTTVNTGGASNVNVVNVGSKEPTTGGIVDNIQGALTVIGNSADTMNVDDTGSTISKTGTLTASTLTGLNMGPSGITYSGLANLNIDLGSGGNTFFINSTAVPTTTFLNSGTGADTVNVLGTGGPTTVNTGGGSNVNTVNVGSTQPPVPNYAPTPNNGNVNNIQGALTVIGNLADTMNVDDSGSRIAKVGTLTPTTLTGMDMGPSGITYSGLANLNIRFGSTATLTSPLSGNTFYINGIDPLTHTAADGGTDIVADDDEVHVANAANSADFNGTLDLTRWESASLTVTGTVNGTVNIDKDPNDPDAPAIVNPVTIGSLGPTGVINITGNVPTMTVRGNLGGGLTVTGTIGSITVGGGTPGTIVAGQIGTIAVLGGFGPVVADITEGGITREIEETTPANPCCGVLPNPYALASTSPYAKLSPSGTLEYINIQYFYEGLDSPSVEGLTPSTNLANPQLTARITNTVSTAPDQYDLSLETFNDVAKFNLARLDAVGISGVRNVDVEGNILTKVTSAASTFFAPDSAPAGIYLPLDNVAGVGVRDYVPDHSIAAKSIQAVAFGSMTSYCGQIETGAVASSNDAANLLAPCTAIVQAGSINNSTVETFRVPFADLATQQVGFFMDDSPSSCGRGQFDNNNVVLVVQGVSTANSSGTANIVTPSNVARGAVVALITVAETFNSCNQLDGSFIENISLCGDGGSIQTQLNVGSPEDCSLPKTAFTPAITSTGPLGDVIIGGSLPNVTAPSIFGSIIPCGPIPSTSTIQTTGIRTDPITQATSQVPADIGRVYVTSTCKGPVVTATTVQANGSGLAGQIICGGNLISQVVANGITGVITVQPVAWEPGAGNLGATFTYPAPSKNVVYLGGVVSNGSMSGPTVVSSCLNKSTVTVNGLVQGGSITTYGSVIGNITINGSMNGPILATGNNSGTIDLNGTVQGGFITTYGSVIGNITICGQVNGPTVSAGNNNTTINVNSGASLKGGSITTLGSVIGNITIGSMNGPTISAGNNSTAINVNGPVQGGSITTSGALNGSITIDGSINGPIVSAGNNNGTIVLNRIVQGGSIVTSGSDIGPISIGYGVNAPIVSESGCNRGTIQIAVPVQGGSVLTGGTLGNLTVGGGITGQIVSIGNMTGTLNVGALQGGLIASAGSINGNLTINGTLTGQLVSVGNINGNVTIKGPLQSGRIASLGSILGNLTINGGIDSQSAIVSGGSIGNKTTGTGLSVGNVNGIVAAVGPINVIKIGSTSQALYYKSNDTPDAAAIDAIFSQGLLSPLSPTDLFDHATLLDLENLALIQTNLNSLTVKSGKLQI
ncbi:MAG: hypothetical protein ABSH35_04325 [Isosphaeraceae bacterium]